MEYTVIKSKRKTIGIEVKGNGKVIVRAPYFVSNEDISELVNKKRAWIEAHVNKMIVKNEKAPNLIPLTADELQDLADKALKLIPERVKYYARIMGVTYGNITIRNQRTRWGSCSGKGNLNFNCLLMLTPPEVIDSVVVHELAHRKEMNHSDRFYHEVLKVYPDYHVWDNWLKENGSRIQQRMCPQN